MVLEICVASADDAQTAIDHGAQRLELNSALSAGGLTPSLGLITQVRSLTKVPLVVMIRPRPAGFAYSAAEFKLMESEIDLACEAGADGIACAVLQDDGRIDRTRCHLLRQLIGSREAVFHRAFDVTPDPVEALEQIIDLGFTRILTSGQQPTAEAGSACIRLLHDNARDRIEILPGAGINPSNARSILVSTGCSQLHASARRYRADLSTRCRPEIHFGSAQEPEHSYSTTDGLLVRQLRAILDASTTNRQ